MPKIILSPLGSSLDTNDVIFKKNQAFMLAKEELLQKNRADIKRGWGEEYAKRVKAKNKLTAQERIDLLADNKEEILYLNTFANFGLNFGDDKKTSPNAGVITALAKVDNKWVVIIANENTIASGSWWPNTPQKIIRAQEIALTSGIPVIYLVDCSGLFLPEQSKTYPGKYGAGHIFKMNSLLSNKGIVQIAGVAGDCIAGGGYMPIISDKVFMTESAYMVIAGAALISQAKSQNISSHDIGGAHIHVHISNCADERVPDDEILIEKIKAEVKKLPSSANNYYRGQFLSSPPKYDQSELLGILPSSPKESYDIRQIIARLIDDSLFYEYDKDSGQEIICGLAKISGLWVGILANCQDLFDHPNNPDKKRPGGILYKEGVSKLSRFSRILNDDGVPMIWLQDVSGFDVGLEAEKQGLLSYGSNLIYGISTYTSPMMTILLRKASGAGYYAMAGMPYDPWLQIATTVSRLAVMEGQTLAVGAFNTKLNADLEKQKILADKIESDMDPYKAAAQMDIDEIVALSELRKYLCSFSEVFYQSTSFRRIKNPRIWSIFDHQ